MIKQPKQQADVTTSEHSMEQLKAWVTMYNNNLNRREDQIDLKILTTEDIGQRLEMIVNNVHVQTQLRSKMRIGKRII